MIGSTDVDGVANRLSPETLLEWMAFGYVEGWFPVSKEPEKQTPEDWLAKLNGNDNPRS